MILESMPLIIYTTLRRYISYLAYPPHQLATKNSFILN